MTCCAIENPPINLVHAGICVHNHHITFSTQIQSQQMLNLRMKVGNIAQ